MSRKKHNQHRRHRPDQDPRPAASEALPRLDEPSLQRAVISAAMQAAGGEMSRPMFDASVAVLTRLELRAIAEGTTALRPTFIAAGRLQQAVDLAFEKGWQPADVAHLVKREHSQRAQRLVIALIAVHARGHRAPDRAPLPWLSQLAELGIYEPSGGVIGGHPGAFAAWARAAKLDADEVIPIALQVLSVLLRAPSLQALLAPPSVWGSTNRGAFPGAAPSAASASAAADVDAKALKLIRALLAKAEATTFEAEADSFTVKAQEMMTRHSIDAAVLDAADRGTRVGAGVESQRVHIDNPYADEKAGLLAVIATVNGARCVWSPQSGFSTVMGFPVDLRLTDLLFTSLLLQASRASAEATAARSDLRTPSFRRAFMLAFADRIGERLETTRTHAAAEAEQHYGSALVPILADREAAVDTAFTEAFPDVTTMRNRRVNAHGYHAGLAAADRANLGAGAAIAGT